MKVAIGVYIHMCVLCYYICHLCNFIVTFKRLTQKYSWEASPQGQLMDSPYRTCG